MAKLKQHRKIEKLDIGITTPSDYTVWVRNLPLNITSEQLANFFENHGSDFVDIKCEVARINYPYDIKDWID